MTSREIKLKSLRRASLLLKGALESCVICPRRCGVDRSAGGLGYCRAPAAPVVYSYYPHHGEEPPFSGKAGSGTIFFSHCNMKCVYCQNYRFSQLDKGETVSVEDLATAMMRLQDAGCHNINLVSPTHFVPQIVDALEAATAKGLDLPIIYNTSGYDLADTIKLLEGVIDIYLPDMRYSDDAAAKEYSDAVNYVEYNRAAIREMRRQVGDLVTDDGGIAKKGMAIRLLVLPEEMSGTRKALAYIKETFGRGMHLSIMSQYYPTYKSGEDERLGRAITPEEYKNVVDEAHLLGLNKGWVQEFPSKADEKFLGTNIKERKIR